jgi:hypothetical protein
LQEEEKRFGANERDRSTTQKRLLLRMKRASISKLSWNALLTLVAIGVLYGLLPTKVSIGPSWLLLAVEAVFLLAFVIAILTRRRVSPVTLRVGSLILLAIVSLTLVVGIGHLISTLKSDVNGVRLIYSGLLLYCFNVLVSALWYWEIDLSRLLS